MRRAAIVLVATGLLAALSSAPAWAAKTYRYDVQVSGYALTKTIQSDGTGEVVMSWRGTWRDVRLRATFFNRRSFSVLLRRGARGSVRAETQFEDTRETIGGDTNACRGTIGYPTLPARLNLFAAALPRTRPGFALSGRLRTVAAVQRFQNITTSRYASVCRNSDGRPAPGPLPTYPFDLHSDTAVNGLRVVAVPHILSTEFERRGGRPRAFPLRALRNGRKASYSTGLLEFSRSCGVSCSESRRYRLGFKLTPRRR